MLTAIRKLGEWGGFPVDETGQIEFKRWLKEKPYLAFGTAVLMLFMATHLFGLQFAGLKELQSSDLFKQFSGYLLLLFVALQWRLGYLRFTNQSKKARGHVKVHKWLGAIAPLLILMHTVEMGHAIQSILLVIFMATVVFGLFSFHELRMRHPWFVILWTVSHVAMAVVLPLLIVYHAYISYTFS